MQRTFVLNDEAALLICDYAKAQRPRIPFPYFAEAFTGSEYSAAVLMLYHGMEKEGIECIGSIRARYDGEKRNPWDEAECGHHYARAMAAWSGILALSGFRYDARSGAIQVRPRSNTPNFRCFWSSGTGWGTFSVSASGVRVQVLKGKLGCREIAFRGAGKNGRATLAGRNLGHKLSFRSGLAVLNFDEPLVINEGAELWASVQA